MEIIKKPWYRAIVCPCGREWHTIYGGPHLGPVPQHICPGCGGDAKHFKKTASRAIYELRPGKIFKKRMHEVFIKHELKPLEEMQ